MHYYEIIHKLWPYLVTAATFLAIVGTAVHILYRKRDTRAAAGWLALVWFAPVLGVCLYWLFGVNRIKRRAMLRFADKRAVVLPKQVGAVSVSYIQDMCTSLGKSNLGELGRMTDKLTRQPLMQGSRITPLLNGDQAFPRMISAIEKAQNTITLCSYIFDNDTWGGRFRTALREASKRGVDVKVLIDSVGARYSFPPITWGLRRSGIDAAEFMKTILPWSFQYFNLRNHRKILVIDGRTGFTGGINIRAGNCLADNPQHPIQDIHFLVEGPITAELQRAFAEDWTFTTHQILEGEKWYPHLEFRGAGAARGISDGPDEDFDKLRRIIMAALVTARESISIVTPYFIPDAQLVSSLLLAALRGVAIDIILPGTSNLRMVKWASDAGLEELLDGGCRIYLSSPPFDHSKIMLVDDLWVLVGSANWDSRSLALNFEFNLECYDTALAENIKEILQGKKAAARMLTLEEIRAQNFFIKLRNSFFRLFSPYL